MTKNMGSIDRALRLIVGLALLVLAFATNIGGQGWVHWAMIAVGAVFSLTAVVGLCPLYSIVGIRTCRS